MWKPLWLIPRKPRLLSSGVSNLTKSYILIEGHLLDYGVCGGMSQNSIFPLGIYLCNLTVPNRSLGTSKAGKQWSSLIGKTLLCAYSHYTWLYRSADVYVSFQPSSWHHHCRFTAGGPWPEKWSNLSRVTELKVRRCFDPYLLSLYFLYSTA